MSWVTKYGYNPRRPKTPREYEKTFLQFMSYTNIRNIDELTPEDLRYYFKQVDDHATSTRKTGKPVFAGQDPGRNKLRHEMARALARLQNKAPNLENPNIKTYRQAQRHSTFREALKSQDTIIHKDRRIFLDKQGRWRDHRGRYTRTDFIDLRSEETKKKDSKEGKP